MITFTKLEYLSPESFNFISKAIKVSTEEIGISSKVSLPSVWLSALLTQIFVSTVIRSYSSLTSMVNFKIPL
jgi:hypothetical protein